jgi:hypothetical protein
MNLEELLAKHCYRKVIALDRRPAGTQVVLTVTFASETGPWEFYVPADARTPYFVVGERLCQTLIVFKDDTAYVGTTTREVIDFFKTDKNKKMYRHVVDNKRLRRL